MPAHPTSTHSPSSVPSSFFLANLVPLPHADSPRFPTNGHSLLLVGILGTSLFSPGQTIDETWPIRPVYSRTKSRSHLRPSYSPALPDHELSCNSPCDLNHPPIWILHTRLCNSDDFPPVDQFEAPTPWRLNLRACSPRASSFCAVPLDSWRRYADKSNGRCRNCRRHCRRRQCLRSRCSFHSLRRLVRSTQTALAAGEPLNSDAS